MNWGRIIGGGIAAGIVMNVADFVQHGLILGDAYKKYPLFSQTQANPLHFLAVAVAISLCAAILFARTRSAWAPGMMGGLTFGFYAGLLGFFPHFYSSLVYEGFPYHLVWCWGGVTMIDFLLAGLALGAIIKRD